MKIKIFLTIILVLVSLAGAFLAFRSIIGINETPMIVENNTTNNETEEFLATETVGATSPKYIGQQISFIGNDPIILQLPKEAIEKHKKYLEELVAAIKKNLGDFESWMAVGIHKKFFNNFVGARDAWEYAKLISPETVLPYLNLANLYAYYLHDPKHAEENFVAAAKLDPNNIFGSVYQAANFYRDFGIKDRALAFYKEVLKTSPNDVAIKTEIERLMGQ